MASAGDGFSSSRRRFSAGSRSRATFAASGSAASSRKLGWLEKGCTEASSPSSRPIARAATCAFIGRPAAFAAPIAASIVRHASGEASFCPIEIDIGRPDWRTISRNSSHSCSRPAKSDTTSNTPCPASPKMRLMPSSSSAPAVRLGVKRPSLARWFLVREVVKPRAPARTASRTRRPMVSISAALGACS